MKTKLFLISALVSLSVFGADLFVSLGTGNNKNNGSRQAPLKNLWKALEIAETGDVIHLAEGNYPGKLKCGWFKMERPVSIIGGYSADFAQRDPLKYLTMFQPKNENNDKKSGGSGLLNLEFDKTMNAPKGFSMVIDGLIFDDGFASSYHKTKGKPAGVETGMWLPPPALGADDKFPSADRYLIFSTSASRAEGDIAIRNCAFINGSNIAVNLNWFKGKVNIDNNVFCNNRIIAINVISSCNQPSVDWKCRNNTVLYTWTRLKNLEDMGFAIRTNANVTAEITKNIIGLNAYAGFDNTKSSGRFKKTTLDDNVFFLNRQADCLITMSPSIANVMVDEFEDIEGTDGIESAEGNIGYDNADFIAKYLDKAYLEGFLTLNNTEKFEDGMLSSECTMFANRYPWKEALKLFGAVKGKGAQAIDK